ncbi:MAG: superoxide dismutase [Phycisphaerales bacterium]
MAFELPELGFAYDALEPHFDAKTMEIHHTKHHAGYIAKANAALEGTDWAGKCYGEILGRIQMVPEDIRAGVQNNVGGHANHSLFWSILSPDGGGAPEGELADAINDAFGSFDEFKTQFENAAATRFGSGWAWLGFDANGKLHVGSTANQDSPIMMGHKPILGLDVWEHAYYLNYQNRRPDYISAFWNVVSWSKVSELYNQWKTAAV